MRFLRQLIREQHGIALVMAVGILGVLSLTGVTLVYYSSANARSAAYSGDDTDAFSLSEAGINEAMTVLSNPDHNALDKYLLGWHTDGTITKQVSEYQNGSVEWWGTLSTSLVGASRWSLTSIGKVKNPAGPGMIERTLRAEVPVTPTTSQPLNNPAWNYIFSTKTGDPDGCDMELVNSVQLQTKLFVAGNLCLKNTSTINGPSSANTSILVIVQGKVTMYTKNSNRIGSAAAPVNELRVVGGCKYDNGLSAWRNPCVGNGAHPTYDNVWATTISNAPLDPPLSKPVADWDSYYLNANPGPYFACIELLGSGYPTFDGDQGSPEAPDVTKMNKSLSLAGQTQNLTPATAYSCKTGGGQLTWNPTATASATYGPARTLTLSGSIFVDGNLKIETPTNTDAYRYSGKATIYARGSIAIKSSKFCGGVSGSDCDFAAWDPNVNMLALVAYSSGGQTEVTTGNSIHLKGASFQGALFAEHDIQLDTTSKSDGPMVAGEIKLGQSVQTSDFPTITEVPAGMPSNPTVYAQPLPPELYKG